jgi:Predicted dehydrogenases and related proteins
MTHMVNNAMRPQQPDLRVVGLVEPDEARAREALTPAEREEARFFSRLEEMVEATRPDALAIGTRCNLHTKYAIEAAAFGLPLFLEKPVAVTMEQAVALEEAYQGFRAGVVVSFPLRVSPLHREARRLIQEGKIGRPEHLLGINYVPYGTVYFDSWYRDYQITQGLFLQKATHDFDYLADLAGAPIVRVAATYSQGRVFRDARFASEGGDALYYEGIGTPETGMNEDSSNALLEFANGSKGVYTQVFYSRREAQARGATVSGPRGTVQFDWYANRLRYVPHFEGEVETWEPKGIEGHFGGDDELARNFLAVVRGEEASMSPLSSGLKSVYACLAAKESAETGRFVDVRPCRLNDQP